MPHLDQLFGEWAIEPRLFNALADQAFAIDVTKHLATIEPKSTFSDPSSDYRYAMVTDGVAIVPISGVMTKHETSMSRWGFGGTSTVLARRDIRRAVSDSSVREILIHVESGGGIARGTKELCDEIRSASMSKPVTTFIEDMGASAAYWASCGSPRIVANAPAKIGSIGTYAVIQDFSTAAERRGVVTHVIRAGEFKGAGEPGTVVTPEQLAEFQREVNSTNEFFVQGVATHRGMSVDDARALADGRVHTAAEAKSLRLIDDVATFDDVFRELSRSKRSPDRQVARASVFEGTPKQRHAKMIDDLMRGSGICWNDAYAHIKTHEPELHAAMLDERLGISKTGPKPRSERRSPNAVLASTRSPKNQSSPTASDDWNAAVDEHIRDGKSRAEALKLANKQQPGLRERYLAEVANH